MSPAPQPAPRVAVELAVQDAAGVRTALAAGADRVELCTALELGGLTPSPGAVEACIEIADAAGAAGYVNVLIRPRVGGYVYSQDELDVCLRDVRAFSRLGVGVVVGASTADGRVDTAALRALVAAADGAHVTFHRAIDVSPDPVAAVEELVGLGIGRVLTSGGAPRSIDGIDVLARMAARAGGRLEIMAGGGVRPEDVGALAAAGVDAVHLSARVAIDDDGAAGPGGGTASRTVTDAGIAAAAVAASGRR